MCVCVFYSRQHLYGPTLVSHNFVGGEEDIGKRTIKGQSIGKPSRNCSG